MESAIRSCEACALGRACSAEPVTSAVVDVDASGRVVEANPAAHRLFARAGQDVAGLPVHALLASAAAAAVDWHVTPCPPSATVAVLRFCGHLGLAGARTFQDTTASLVTRGISHDLNNLFTCILACASARRPPRDADDLASNLAAIREAASRAAELVELLVGPDATRAPPRPSCVEEVLRWTGVLLARVGEPSCVQVSVSCDDSIVELSPVELQQILINLGLNAIEAMDTGGSLTLRARRENGEVRFDITDTGPGIERTWQAQMFADGASSKSRCGHGLGLATVKRIVDRAGGRLGVDSGAGDGSTFTIHLPAARIS